MSNPLVDVTIAAELSAGEPEGWLWPAIVVVTVATAVAIWDTALTIWRRRRR